MIAAAAPQVPTGSFGVNVTAIALPGNGQSLTSIREGIADQLAATLHDGLLLDLSESLLDDGEALRVLATFVGDRGDELTVEQWITLVSGTQVVISATVPSLDYHWHASAVGELVDSVEFDV